MSCLICFYLLQHFAIRSRIVAGIELMLLCVGKQQSIRFVISIAAMIPTGRHAMIAHYQQRGIIIHASHDRATMKYIYIYLSILRSAFVLMNYVPYDIIHFG